MSKLKLPIIIAIVIAAVGAGLFASGMVPGKTDGPIKKHVVEPVALAEPFTVNLADTDGKHFAVINVALQLEPMGDDQWVAFNGETGGHGGGGEAPGPAKLATYPKFSDAVMNVTSGFTTRELNSKEGKLLLKEALLTRFAEIAEQDAADYKAGAEDGPHAGPPYHVMDVFFTKYIIS
jgi:flagellar basal body-associated protein FliL